MPKDAFDNYDFQSQSRSINGRLNRLEKAIMAHVKRAREERKSNPIDERTQNLRGMISRLEKDHTLHDF
jgi:hypothetical protein